MGCLLCGKYSRQWDDAVQAARIHPVFIPVTGLKCSYGQTILKNFTEILVGKTEMSGTEPARPVI